MSARKESFWRAYRESLIVAMREHPDEYMPGLAAQTVAFRMEAASERTIRAVNIDGRGFRGACKTLGIKQTYKAIEAYLAEAQS